MVMALSDTIAVLKDGRLIADDTPAAIAGNPEVQAAYFGGGSPRHDPAPRGRGRPHLHRPAPHPPGRLAPGPAGRGDGAPGPQRGGQDDDHPHDHGPPSSPPWRGALRRAADARLAAPRRRPARDRLRAGGSGDLPDPNRGREPARRPHRGRRRVTGAPWSRPRPLPRPGAIPPRPGRDALRRTEADAVHRPGPREPEPSPPDRRAVEGPRTDHCRASDRSPPDE